MRIRFFVSALLVCLLSLSVPVTTHGARRHHDDDDPPIRLSVSAPQDLGQKGSLQSSRWPLVLRLEVAESPALIESGEGEKGRREALIIADPDDCIDMRDFPLVDPGMPYEPCAGPDELYIEFTSEHFDSHDLLDDRTGNFLVRERLVDDAYVEGELLNKPYLRNRSGKVAPLPRPQTGDDLLDGYGYGPDDDLVGLVAMADIGGARVFDPDFNLTPRVIRNVAGFFNGVAIELADRRGKTALVASMHVLAGLFEPVVLVDLAVDGAHADYLRRLESGPVEALRFPRPPSDDDELLTMLVESYSPVEFDLRAVIVRGIAPEFIHDMDSDGRYTARDVERMGYELLSNPVKLHVREQLDLAITDTVAGRTCPSRSLIFSDLDGNGDDGAIDCSGTGGARRLKRIPR